MTSEFWNFSTVNAYSSYRSNICIMGMYKCFRTRSNAFCLASQKHSFSSFREFGTTGMCSEFKRKPLQRQESQIGPLFPYNPTKTHRIISRLDRISWFLFSHVKTKVVVYRHSFVNYSWNNHNLAWSTRPAKRIWSFGDNSFVSGRKLGIVWCDCIDWKNRIDLVNLVDGYILKITTYLWLL